MLKIHRLDMLARTTNQCNQIKECRHTATFLKNADDCTLVFETVIFYQHSLIDFVIQTQELNIDSVLKHSQDDNNKTK